MLPATALILHKLSRYRHKHFWAPHRIHARTPHANTQARTLTRTHTHSPCPQIRAEAEAKAKQEAEERRLAEERLKEMEAAALEAAAKVVVAEKVQKERDAEAAKVRQVGAGVEIRGRGQRGRRSKVVPGRVGYLEAHAPCASAKAT